MMESSTLQLLVIAIDGPAASGKSSVAKQLASTLEFNYVDTGAMYRLVTWFVLERGVDPGDAPAVAGLVEGSRFQFGFHDRKSFLFADGVDPGEAIRSREVNARVSQISAIQEVRQALVAIQRELAESGAVVMEGRDIGSFVFPETPFKFYIDAAPEIRQQRRNAQGASDHVASRDRIDAGRATAPLTIAEDATVIDSTHLTIDGVCGEIIGQLKRKGLVIPELSVRHG